MCDKQKYIVGLVSGEEGSELCRILANKHQTWRTKIRGDIFLNGLK